MSEYREIRGSLQGERCEHKSWVDLCEQCEIDRLRASNAELVKSLKAALQFLDTLYPIPIDTSEKAKASIYLWGEADPSLAIANAEKTSA